MADDLQSGSGDPEQQLVAEDHDTLQETVFSEDLSQPPEEDDWDAADEQASSSESSADGGDPTEDAKRDDGSPQQQSEPFIKVDGVNFRFPGGPTAMVVVAGISVAVAVARLVLRRVRRHRRMSLRSIIDVVFDLPPSAVGEEGLVRPLEGNTFVVDTIIASAAGLKSGVTPDDVPQRPLNAIDLLRNAGARGIGQVSSEAWCVSPGSITPLMSKTPNPSFPKLLVLGAQAPAAAAVAGGVCDYALAPEVLGEARIAACSCGVACLRPSLAAVDSPGLAAMCPSLLTPAVLARDARALAKAGAALGLPGSPKLTGLITRFLVLDDLFQQCDSQVQKSQKVLLKALAQWGGGDSLAQLPICKFLAQQMPSWRACLPAARHAAPMAPLEALAAAASAIMRSEMDAMTADWRPAEPVPARLSCSAGGSGSAMAEAGDVMSAAQAVLRSSLRGDPDTPHIVVLPVLPRSPPPRAAASGQDFLVGDCTAVAELFCSIASLSGLPSVVLPVASSSSSSDRSPASGVMLVGAFRQDQQLLAVASKLQPVLEQVQQEVEAAGGRSPTLGDKPASTAAGTSSRASGAKAGKKAAVDEAVMAEAEKWKQQGNELFYKNKCEEAVQAYSQALLLMPRNAKYLSNRAMALLKLGLYQEAEDDCTKALQEEISAKALLRRGTARMALQDWEGARKDYTQVLTLEPNNRQARDELRNLQTLLKDMPAATSAAPMPEEMNGFW